MYQSSLDRGWGKVLVIQGLTTCIQMPNTPVKKLALEGYVCNPHLGGGSQTSGPLELISQPA